MLNFKKHGKGWLLFGALFSILLFVISIIHSPYNLPGTLVSSIVFGMLPFTFGYLGFRGMFAVNILFYLVGVIGDAIYDASHPIPGEHIGSYWLFLPFFVIVGLVTDYYLLRRKGDPNNSK